MADVRLTPSLCVVRDDSYSGSPPASEAASADSSSSLGETPAWAQSSSEEDDNGEHEPLVPLPWTPSKDGFVSQSNVGRLEAGSITNAAEEIKQSPVTRRLRLISKDGDSELSHALRRRRTKHKTEAVGLASRLPIGRSVMNVYRDLSDGVFLTTRCVGLSFQCTASRPPPYLFRYGCGSRIGEYS